MKIIVCKKCKKNNNLKIVTPYDKEGYWLECEKCNYKQKLPDNQKTKEMFNLHDIYVRCLSFAFVRKNTPELDDIKEMVWEKISEVEQDD